MNDPNIIDTNSMNQKNRFQIKNLTNAQKASIISGGVLMSAGAGVLMKYIFSNQFESPVIPSVAADSSEQDFNFSNESEEYSVNDSSSNIEKEYLDGEEFINLDQNFDEVENYDISFYSDATFATEVNDEMTFSTAFATAREEVGMGGWFNWNAQSYSTYTREEWSEMSPEDKETFINDVISQSDFQSLEVQDTSTFDDDIQADVETWENDEYIQTNEIEHGNESYEITDEESDEIDIPTIQPEMDEDLTEDIIIVKPVRGADMDEDGVIDAIVYDHDDDGKVDLIALDQNGDGKYESFMINEDGDEDLDVFVIDSGGNGLDGQDSVEEISDVVNMEDFVILENEELPEDLSFIDDIFGDEEGDDVDVDNDLSFDEPGL